MTKRMRKAALFLVALLLLMAGCATFPAAPLDMSRLTLHERMVNSVVVLPGCAGTVLRNDGREVVVLTAAHCVRSRRMVPETVPATYLPVPITAELGGRMASCLGVVGSVSLPRDLAIIRATGCDLPTAVAVLARKPPELGGTVYAVGHPLSSSYVLTKGIASRLAVVYDGDTYMLLSAPVVFGNSGGPCFNARGEMVGLVKGFRAVSVKMADGKALPFWAPVTHLGLAIPLDDVRRFLVAGGFPDLAK